MSPERQDERHACSDCLARSSLIALLSARIEHAASDPSRLLDLLCLDEQQLIAAIGGRKRKELQQRHEANRAAFERAQKAAPILPGVAAPSAHSPGAVAPAFEETTFCRHDPLHRRLFGRLRFSERSGAEEALGSRRHAPLLPAALHLQGGFDRLQRLLETPLVAILGAARASDYGMEMAAALARGLAASGVGVASRFAGGVCAAAHLGVLEAGARPLVVMAGGIDVRKPASLGRLHRRIVDDGVAISELPRGFAPRRWSERASERILAALASLVIVVEADTDDIGMIAADLARTRGARVAALPGRVTSPRARGPHALMREGAALVACPQDALDLLYGVGETDAAGGAGMSETAGETGRASTGNATRGTDGTATDLGSRLTRQQLALLERIGAGEDTLAHISQGPEREASMLALGELRRKGLLAHGDGGRYLPRVSLDRAR